MEESTELKLINMSDVQTQEIKWLWYPFIAYGKMSIVQGDPGDGKSTLVLNIAAKLSRGERLEPEMNIDKPVNVIYQTAEDGLADTVKPRLEQAGADCSRISIIDESEKSLSMIDERIEKAIIAAEAGLLILDPIQAYLGGGTDMNRANEARELTKRLGSIAERTGCAIVLIGHMNKGSGAKAAYRGMGSKVANKEVNDWFGEQIKEKSKGRNHDLTVAEYKVTQESRKLEAIQQQNNEEQAKNTKLRSSNASISYQIATLEKSHNRNIDRIAADEKRLEKVRDNIDAAENEYAKYSDMITDKKNELEVLTSKENELIERTKIAGDVYDMFRQGGDDDVREKLIDVMYENQRLQEENKSLRELLEKAYEFMKQFVIDGVNLLERFLESVGKVMEKIKNSYDR